MNIREISAVRLRELRDLIKAADLRWSDEAELQEGIARLLTGADVLHFREIRLSPADRIDFTCTFGGRGFETPRPGGAAQVTIGVEVKIRGQRAELLRQVERYAAHPTLDAVLVVTPLLRLVTSWPSEIGGKPIGVASLVRL